MPDPRGASFVPSRARRRGPPRAAVPLLALVGAWVLLGRPGMAPAPVDGALDLQPVPPAVAEAAEAAEAAGAPGSDVPAGTEQATVPAPPPVMAASDGFRLHVPGTAPVLVAYHEASRSESLPLVPLGTLRDNANATRFEPPAADAGGLVYDVQVSRGRLPGPTTAVDVVLPRDAAVLAPVAGTVVQVRDYALYGRHPDVRIELVPDDAPERVVVLIHVEDPQVTVGQRVELGEPLAARARLFPFSSIVDRATEPERYGHVHVEVKRLADLEADPDAPPRPAPAP